ncbi:MAG: ABC transporter ATP-binding protein [Pyrinomonadaceae bacterium]
MALLKLENLSKHYGNFGAVRDLTLEIERGEFFGILGASGSGKTTILRMIAGLQEPSSGKIIFDGQDLTELAPEKRDFGIVFQNYALLPQLNVFENVALGLKARKLDKDTIESKVTELLSLVKSEDFAERRVDELSGGQQQRVAIAMALAIEPQLLLFDEPLSNLDAALREETRGELRELVKKLGLTALYVTHDQDEVFALCDRIAVMENGQLLQIGTPRELYDHPQSVAVARFLGRNNLIQAARLPSSKIPMPEFQTLAGEHRLFVDKTEKENLGAINQIVTLAIRPENVILPFGAAFPEDNLFKATVVAIQYFGTTTRIVLDANGLQIETIVLRLVGLNVGDDCMVSLPPNRISVFKD